MRSSFNSYEDHFSLQKENEKYSFKPSLTDQNDNDLMVK